MRLEKGVAQAWEPEADGTYWSRTLGIGLGPEGTFLRVLDGEGKSIPTREERLWDNDVMARDQVILMREVAARDAALAIRDQEIEALRTALAQLHGHDMPLIDHEI